MAQRVDDRGLLDGGNDDGSIPVAYPQDVSIMTTVPVTADGGSAYPPPSAAAAAASASAASASYEQPVMTTVPVGATMSTVPVGSAAKYDEPDTNQLLHGSGSGSSATGTRSRNGAPIGTGKEEPVKPGYRDPLFALAFVVHVIVIAIVAFSTGIPALRQASELAAASSSTRTQVAVEVVHPVVGILTVSAILGAILSASWMWFMKSHATSMIKCTLYTSAVLQLATGVFALFFSGVMGVIIMLFALLTVWYIFSIRNRIPFASANLKAALTAVQKYPATFFVAFGALVVHLLWIVLWALALFGVEANTLGDGYICEFLMLVSFYWGIQVIKNVVHCTVAGTVGSWWFVPNPADPTLGALRRACTTSFGSVCLGSLLVAIIQALRVVATSLRRAARRRRGGAAAAMEFLACCAEGLLRCLARLVQYFNRWAFVEVALYGKNFTQAGKDCMRLFENRGWTAIINDDLVGRALTIGSFMVGCVCALAGAMWAHAVVDDHGWVFGGAFLSFLVGFSMCLIMSGVVESAVLTIFVCFADHPEALAATHPDHLNALSGAWAKFHPKVWSSCGYHTRFGGGGGGAGAGMGMGGAPAVMAV